MTDWTQSTPAKQEENKKKWFDYWKEYRWQQGQSGNPKWRPKTKTLKEFAREFLSNMSEEWRIEYFSQLDPEVVWKMAEWNPATQTDLTTGGKPLPIIDLNVLSHNSNSKDSTTDKKD